MYRHLLILCIGFLTCFQAGLMGDESQRQLPAVDIAPVGKIVNILLIPGNSPVTESSTLLFDNGAYINSPGSGAGGADESVLQNSTLGMQALGFRTQWSNDFWLAEDFTVSDVDGWRMDSLALYLYQSGSSTTSSITAVYYQIWDGDPRDPGSSVIFGDMQTSRLLTSRWDNTYRVSETTSGTNSQRPVMRTLLSGGVLLPQGTYWIEWAADGSLSSGPWGPPVTITSQNATGNALQRIATSWQPVVDGGTQTPQGFPFLIFGDLGGGANIPNSPTNFTAASNHGTPTEIALSWDDPSSYVNGDPLTDFQILIARDGALIDSLGMGVEHYTDSGLLTGTSYHFSIWAKDNTGAASAPVFTSAIAGGVPQPAIAVGLDSIITTLSSGVSSTVVSVSITNSGLPSAPDLQWSASVTATSLQSRPAQALLPRRQTERPPAAELARGDGPARVLLAPGYVHPPVERQTVLYDNGAIVNSPGTGVGGADESVLQTSLGMTSLGFNHNSAYNFRVAEDFTVPAAGWQIDQIKFYAYQTLSPTSSTISAVRFQIWDGPPGDAGSAVVFGDTTTNRLLTSAWTNIFRVAENSSGTSDDRPVMENTCAAGIFLPAGTYWIDWSTEGTLSSGPWAPPVTINGQTATGNALQLFGGGWMPMEDNGAPQGLPFVLENGPVSPWITVLHPAFGTIPAGAAGTLNVLLTCPPADTVLTGQIEITSNDPIHPSVMIPVVLTCEGGEITAIGEPQHLPRGVYLGHNYPNPFNPATHLEFGIENTEWVNLTVYDLLGRKVATLLNEQRPAGNYRITWNGRNDSGIQAAGGIYYYRLTAGERVLTRKMTLLR